MFRFSIRDTLWITLAAALTVGWYADRARLSSSAKSLGSSLRTLESELKAEREKVHPSIIVIEPKRFLMHPGSRMEVALGDRTVSVFPLPPLSPHAMVERSANGRFQEMQFPIHSDSITLAGEPGSSPLGQ